MAVAVLAACSPADDELDAEEVNPSRAEAIQQGMPPCGTVLQTWNGTPAYSNGRNTGTGYSCAGFGRYGLQYQCDELVMRHYTRNWGLRWPGNARDLLRNSPRDRVAVYRNGDRAHPPVPGDMLVWEQGVYGHVALITDVTPTSLRYIEQNAAGSGAVTLPYDGARVGTRWGTWTPAGWAHAYANTGAAPTPTPPSDAGVPDASAPAPDARAPSPESCGRYAGWSVRTCVSDAEAVRCVNGALERTRCPAGGRCVTRPNGFDDVCVSALGAGEACGEFSWINVFTCNQAHTQRVICAAGQLVREPCARGCVTRPNGVDDVCAR